MGTDALHAGDRVANGPVGGTSVEGPGVERFSGACPGCGYDLVGLVNRGTPKCPECGLTLDEALWRTIRRRDRKRAVWSLVLALAGPFVFDLLAAGSGTTGVLALLAPIFVVCGGLASCAGFYGVFRLLAAERPFFRLDWVILIGAIVQGVVVAVGTVVILVAGASLFL